MTEQQNHREEKRPFQSQKPVFRGTQESPRRPMPGSKRPATSRKTARDAALKSLQEVVRGGAYASQALSRQLNDSGLSPEDKRLATGIFYFAAENRLRIRYALAKFLQTNADPVTEDILHIAAAQILFMDKIPDHAAVDEAVKQARASGREGLTGLVNGVLRSLLRARDAGEDLLPNRDDDSMEYLSVRYSVSLHIVKRLVSAYGEQMAENIMAYAPEERSRAVVRPNTLAISPDEFEQWLTHRNFHWEKSDVRNAYIITSGGDLSYLDSYKRGYFSMQGESSMLAAYACLPKPGMQILDACAAPGGKSALLCEEMRGTGRVYAWDVHEHRVELIRAAGKRLSLDNLRPSVRDARAPYAPFEYLMDAVLVDAPCSGLGVISDKPDIKYRLSEESLASLAPLQAEILENCARFVKVDGLLVYSTCTILPEENEKQVLDFQKRHPEFVPDENDEWLPERLRGVYRNGMAQFLSCRDGVEGFFIARMRRKSLT